MRDDEEPKPSASADPGLRSKAPAGSPVAEDPAAQAGPAKSAPGSPARKSDVQAYIGRQLRAVYDDVALQPVPDRFLDLMKQLEAKALER